LYKKRKEKKNATKEGATVLLNTKSIKSFPDIATIVPSDSNDYQSKKILLIKETHHK
jgi:hypothetical protein